VDYEKPMRTCHKHSCAQWQDEFGTAPAVEESKAECSTAAFPKLFKFREAGRQFSLVTMSHPSLRTVAPPPCLPQDIKDLLKEDLRFFVGGWVDWWAACQNDTTGGLLSYARD
jgi:hypothetical protein